MYKGTKFNTTKEDVAGETYLGIQIFRYTPGTAAASSALAPVLKALHAVARFYLRCSTCAAEITMKTDPENTDYTMEHGASRNYEPWREKAKQTNAALADR